MYNMSGCINRSKSLLNPPAPCSNSRSWSITTLMLAYLLEDLSVAPNVSFHSEILIFHCIFQYRSVQVTSSKFVGAGIDLKLPFGTSKAFPKRLYSLYVSFKLIYDTSWCLFTDLTLFILFWVNQWAESPWHSSGRPAGLPTFCRWANRETEHLKWRSPEFSCMHFAFDLWFSANYSQQTNEDKHLHTSSCRSVSQCHHTACVVCCLPLPWLIFCLHFFVLDPSLPL